MSETSVALTVAGYDPSSGAGVTADLKVFAAFGLFGVSAITALTVQSTLGVLRVERVDAAILRLMLGHLVADVVPGGVKVGMLGEREGVLEVADFLVGLRRIAPGIPVVLDPVVRSSSGTELLDADGVAAMKSELLPLVTWITPNWQELGVLMGREVRDAEEAVAAMNVLQRQFSDLNVVATGGDLVGEPVDVWRGPGGEVEVFTGERVHTTSTHGTGCAFSSALLCRLMKGDDPAAAVRAAKQYVEGALRHAPGIGQGKGPLGLLWPLTTKVDATKS